MAGAETAEAENEHAGSQRKTQRCGIADCLQGQIIEGEHGGKYHNDSDQHQNQQPLPLQVSQKFHCLFLHQISLALAGADQIRQSGCLQFPPQTPDIDAQSVFVHEAVGFP